MTTQAGIDIRLEALSRDNRALRDQIDRMRDRMDREFRTQEKLERADKELAEQRGFKEAAYYAFLGMLTGVLLMLLLFLANRSENGATPDQMHPASRSVQSVDPLDQQPAFTDFALVEHGRSQTRNGRSQFENAAPLNVGSARVRL